MDPLSPASSSATATSKFSGTANANFHINNNSNNKTRKRSAVKRRWQSAVFKQKIFLSADQQTSEEDLSTDPFGEALTNLLNENPAFHFSVSRTSNIKLSLDKQQSENRSDNELTFFLSDFSTPVISQHNLHILKRYGRRLLRLFEPDRPLQSMEKMLYHLTGSADFYQSEKTSWRRVGFISTVAIMISISFTIATSHTIVVLSSGVVLNICMSILWLLVDPALCQIMTPRWAQHFCGDLWKFYNDVEDITLQRHRFRGREWDQSEFISDDLSQTDFPLPNSSQDKKLSQLPPPDYGLNAPRLQNERHWSKDTTAHNVAIDFVSRMIQEEIAAKKHRRLARKNYKSLARKNSLGNRGRRRKSKKDTEITIYSIPSASWEESIGDDENDKNSSQNDKKTSTGELINESIEMKINRFSRSRPSWQQHSFGMPPDEEDDDDSTRAEESVDGSRTIVSMASSVDDAADLPWIDVGAKIGLQLLNSAHVHRAMASSETSERIVGSSLELLELDAGISDSKNGVLSPSSATSSLTLPKIQVAGGSAGIIIPPQRMTKPVHSLWTSANSAGMHSDVNEDTRTLSPKESKVAEVMKASRCHSLSNTPTSTKGILERIPEHHSPPDELVVPNLGSGDTEVVSVPTKSDVSRIPVPSPMRKRSKSMVVPKSTLQKLINPELRRKPLATGVKVAVPLFPLQPNVFPSLEQRKRQIPYQMGTVVQSKRIMTEGETSHLYSSTNCLSVTVKLEKSFLRNGEFAELTFRVMDSWSSRFMPKHSKAPIGSCVATTFGLGVLVGWRVEDDIHVVRSLWQRRGAGSSNGYFNRDAIHGVVEASVGFQVDTKLGEGQVLAYVDGGTNFENGRYFVRISKEGRYKDHVVELYRNEVLSCHGAQFIPVIEHIREAAQFQIQLDNYEASISGRELVESDHPGRLAAVETTHSVWQTWSDWADILWKSFLRVVKEDKEIDDGLSGFFQSVITFLERLDGDLDPHEEKKEEDTPCLQELNTVVSSDFEVQLVGDDIEISESQTETGLWIMNDILGGIFSNKKDRSKSLSAKPSHPVKETADRKRYYERAFAIIRVLMKTISVARVSSLNDPHLRLALAVVYDIILFVKKVFIVQQKNASVECMDIWARALEEVSTTFGPIKERFEKVGFGIAQRMEKQGRRAKTKLLRFMDEILQDERMLFSLEQGDWENCGIRLELALVRAKIIQKENLVHYRKAVAFLARQWKIVMSDNGDAASRNGEKLVFFAQFVQWLAVPKRSLLKLFERKDVLELLERIMVRVFQKEEVASRMLVIHACNFHSLRHLRLLKDFSTSGRLWMPVLDAADEEFAWLVNQLPEQTKDILVPISDLFSLCVAHFHEIEQGDLTKDWMDFLFEEDAVKIIDDIDKKLILAVESFAKDVKDTMTVLPYYSSIDDDLLGLMDEVDLDQFLRDASHAMEDEDKLNEFIREKTTVAIERFLNYLPRMSIPVEKRELMEGWVLTCRGEDGGDLTLSDVKVHRENLICQILGGDAIFFPMFCDGETNEAMSIPSPVSSPARATFAGAVVEESVLDQIRELILQAQRFGCWKVGTGGILSPPSDQYAASVLQNLPISPVLNCGIDLWKNLEIDDDELLEIAIRDVSHQIQLQKEKELSSEQESLSNSNHCEMTEHESIGTTSSESLDHQQLRNQMESFESNRIRFNPRVDPTVFFLEMKNLTFQLDAFKFRIEKSEQYRTILDPVFEGIGCLTILNVSIRLRVECAKERKRKTALGETFYPVLILRELTTSLEKVDLRVKDTGYGADWFVNKAVEAFSDDITKVVAENLKDQVLDQVSKALKSVNSYFLVNPEMLLTLLGVSLDDLEDHIIL